MSSDWISTSAPALVSFLAALVECVEALTVVLAVGATRGWRGALAGALTALGLLALLIAALGHAVQRVPLHLAELVIGVLLVLFGMRWLRKAMLRGAGAVARRDEQAIYDSQVRGLAEFHLPHRRWDGGAIATTFNFTMIEGLEVVFIVLAIGGGDPDALGAAIVGAVAALALVAAAGLALHRPVTAVPENTLKLAVGVMLAGLGTFWVGEGAGLAWPGDEWAVLALTAGFAAVAVVGIRMNRVRAA